MRANGVITMVSICLISILIGISTFVRGCKDLLEKGTVISSPANKNIVYKLENAFDIITTHEQRHLEQAREVLADLK